MSTCALLTTRCKPPPKSHFFSFLWEGQLWRAMKLNTFSPTQKQEKNEHIKHVCWKHNLGRIQKHETSFIVTQVASKSMATVTALAGAVVASPECPKHRGFATSFLHLSQNTWRHRKFHLLHWSILLTRRSSQWRKTPRLVRSLGQRRYDPLRIHRSKLLKGSFFQRFNDMVDIYLKTPTKNGFLQSHQINSNHLCDWSLKTCVFKNTTGVYYATNR